MKIVVIGGTGLIGSKVVKNLRQQGHDVIAASPSTGVNAVTGEGLADALADAQVVVDVSNSPSFEDGPVMEFFENSTRNLLAAEQAAGVEHHVALSVVGTERLQASGYFRAKLVQEDMIKASPIPYTIIRATQFFEFAGAIAYTATEGETVRLTSALVQPMVSDDVAGFVAMFAQEQPYNGTVEIGGPEKLPLADFVRGFLTASGDPRKVIVDDTAKYFGLELDDRSLNPEDDARLGETTFGKWLSRAYPQPASVR
jgi:uncharacterized protein YbjT (DUF2867 family)